MTTACFTVPLCSASVRKPAGYWKNRENLKREVLEFQQSRGHPPARFPTSTELLESNRFDLYRAIQRQGGFYECACRLGMQTLRRPRGYWDYGLGIELREFASKTGDSNLMPSTSDLRTFGRHDILNAVQAVGGIRMAARIAGLLVPKKEERRPIVLPRSLPSNTTRTFETVKIKLREFSVEHCGGRQPRVRELIEAKRHDLLHDMRLYGGLIEVSNAAGLEPTDDETRRPRGYWNEFSVVRKELQDFTAHYGFPGLMPTRDQLIRAGRRDLCYAITRHGGFSTVSARLHVMWVGPCNYWRVFRNLRKRLLDFIRRHGPHGIMPTTPRLHRMGRQDLIYGIALHGGVMSVAGRLNLRVRYAKRKSNYWADPVNVSRELTYFMECEPIERRTHMPSSVALVQAGRADLANGVRDHGGWVYYAQRLGLRFAFERRVSGFWRNESNVRHELELYLHDRYGDWDFPGIPPAVLSSKSAYVPSLEMLKRDGRSDIAFAIQRYHGGEIEFAQRHGFIIADDTVPMQPLETLRKWPRFEDELKLWVDQFGAAGIMPKRIDFIRTGRYDLRYAVYYHGGRDLVARKAGLIVCHGGDSGKWIGNWLALYAAKLGTVMLEGSTKSRAQTELDGSVVAIVQFDGVKVWTPKKALMGRRRVRGERMLSGKSRAMRRKTQRKIKNEVNNVEDGNKLGGISLEELNEIRERYKHVAEDDIILV